jgi:arylsulfatase A-like enzyme
MTRKVPDLFELAKSRSAARLRYVTQTQKVDRAFGRLMRELKRRGDWENTVVALTADHGELLNEWGVVMHGGPLSEGSVRIPFVLKGLSRSCPYRDLPLSAADVYPSILGELGISRVPEPDDLGWPPAPTRSLLMYAFRGGRGFAIVSNSRKYIFDARSRLLEVYDLLDDPGERRNIITTVDVARADTIKRALPRMMTVHMAAN